MSTAINSNFRIHEALQNFKRIDSEKEQLVYREAVKHLANFVPTNSRLLLDSLDCNKENEKQTRGRSHSKLKRFVGRAKSATRVLSRHRRIQRLELSDSDTEANGLVFHKEITSFTVNTVDALCRLINEDITQEGLFRITGSKARQKFLRTAINKGESIILSDDDGRIIPNERKVGTAYTNHDAANILKELLRSLPQPLLTTEPSIIPILREDLEMNYREYSIEPIQILFSLLPNKSRLILRSILQLLKNISDHSETNKMTSSNLAIIFCPIFLPSEDDTCSQSSDQASMQSYRPTEQETTYICYLIQNYKDILIPSELLVNKILELEALLTTSSLPPSGSNSPKTVMPNIRNTPKKAAKLLGLALNESSRTDLIDLKSIPTPVRDTCDSKSHVEVSGRYHRVSRISKRRTKERPTILSIAEQMKQMKRATNESNYTNDDSSPSKKCKDYDKLVDLDQVSCSPEGEFRLSDSSDYDNQQMSGPDTPEIRNREEQRQRNVLVDAANHVRTKRCVNGRKGINNQAMPINLPNIPTCPDGYVVCWEDNKGPSLQEVKSVQPCHRSQKSWTGASFEEPSSPPHRQRQKPVRQNSARRTRPMVVKTAKKHSTERDSENLCNARLQLKPLVTTRPVPIPTITPWHKDTKKSHLVRRNSSNTSSERGRQTAILRKSSSGRRERAQRPVIITRSNSKKMQKHRIETQGNIEIRQARNIPTANHNRETQV